MCMNQVISSGDLVLDLMAEDIADQYCSQMREVCVGGREKWIGDLIIRVVYH